MEAGRCRHPCKHRILSVLIHGNTGSRFSSLITPDRAVLRTSPTRKGSSHPQHAQTQIPDSSMMPDEVRHSRWRCHQQQRRLDSHGQKHPLRLFRVFSARVRSAKFFAMASGFHESEQSMAGRWRLRDVGGCQWFDGRPFNVQFSKSSWC